MQEEGLVARARVSDHDHRSRRICSTASSRRTPLSGGSATREFVIGSSGKLYLAAVLDLCSRFIVGWAVSAVNDRHVTIKALEMA